VEPEPEVVPEPVKEEEKGTNKKNVRLWSWLLALVSLLISLLIGFALGYMYRFFTENTSSEANNPVEKVSSHSVAADSMAAVPVIGDSVKTKVDSTSNATTDKPKPVTQTKSTAAEPDYMKYDAMDSRLHYGAYYIVGTASVEKVREGDNVERFSRRYIGRDMSCYIEVYNGITASTPLKEGQELKIPKLVTKKSMKAQLEKE
jgi:hypothetical protein